ncbi:MAG: hypothetical protein AB7O26_03030 [Planctomycetaceae bacterium]
MTLRPALKCFVAAALFAGCLPVTHVQAGSPKAAAAGPSTSLGQQVLTEFDSNRNGRLESGERSTASRVLAAKEVPDAARNSLRRSALAEFDENRSGKLDPSEIRDVLDAASAAATAQKNSAAAKSQKSSAAVTGSALKSTSTTSGSSTTQQPFRMRQGLTGANQNFLMQFDADGSGSLDPTELSAAQAALAQLLAQGRNTSGLNGQQMMSQFGSGSTSGTSPGVGAGLGSGMMGPGGANCPTGTDTGTTTDTTSTGTTTASTSTSTSTSKSGTSAARQGLNGQAGPRMGRMAGGGGGGMARMGGGGSMGMRRGR